MFLFESGEGHEPTGQVIGYLDDILYNFFSNYIQKTLHQIHPLFFFLIMASI
jgi:hypothetical protein